MDEPREHSNWSLASLSARFRRAHSRSKARQSAPINATLLQLRNVMSSPSLPSRTKRADSTLTPSIRGASQAGNPSKRSTPPLQTGTSNLPRGSELSIVERVRAVLEFRCPLKRHSRLRYSLDPTTSERLSPNLCIGADEDISEALEKILHIKGPLDVPASQAVLKTFDALVAHESTYDWTLNDIRRHSSRFAFSTPDLLATSSFEVVYGPAELRSLERSPSQKSDRALKKARREAYVQELKSEEPDEEPASSQLSLRDIISGVSDVRATELRFEPSLSNAALKSSASFSRVARTRHSLPSRIMGTARHYQHAVSKFITAAKRKRSGSPWKVPSNLIWEGEEGALAFVAMTNNPSFDYKAIASIKLVLNANDWTPEQDDFYSMAMTVFASHSDHRLKRLEIVIKGPTLFTRHTLTVGAGIMRMAYLKQIRKVSEKYAFWQKIYDGTATRETMLECPPTIRRSIKSTVKTLLGVKNVPQVSIHGAMEAQLKDEIITTCQTPGQAHGGTFIGPSRTQANDISRTCGFRLDGPIPAAIFKLPDPTVNNNNTMRSKSKLLKKPMAKHAEPRITSNNKLTGCVNPNTQGGASFTIDKPLPPPPLRTSNFTNPVPHFALTSPLHQLSPPPFPQTVPSMPSEYMAYLPSSAHLFIDRELPTLVDSDSDDSAERGSSKTVTRLLIDESHAIKAIPNDLIKTAINAIHEIPNSASTSPSETQSSQSSEDPATAASACIPPSVLPEYAQSDTTKRRSTRSQSSISSPRLAPSPTPSRKRRRLNSHVSSIVLWDKFATDPREDEVIDTRGSAPLLCGTMDELVRICAHRTEPRWDNTKGIVSGLRAQIQEGFLGDCVLGWKVVNKDGLWVVGREDEE